MLWSKKLAKRAGGKITQLDGVRLGNDKYTGKMLFQQKHMGMIEPIHDFKPVRGTVTAAFRMM